MKRLLNLHQASTPTPLSEDLQLRIGQAALMAQRAARHTFRHLWDAEVCVFSQWGEDGILDYLCDLTGISKPRVVEFGAGDFTECNSRCLAENRSASVLAVDARTDLESSVMRRDIRWRTTVIPRTEWITPDTAPLAMAAAHEAFGGVDIVSLDIDGNDYWVAESLPLEGVSIVVVEYNPAFGHERSVTVPRDDQFDRTAAHFSWVYYGASLRAFIELFADKGLTFVGTNRACNNAFFLRSVPDSLPFPVPGADLSRFTDVRFREARNESGVLALEHPSAILRRSPELALVDTASSTLTNLGAVLGR